MTSNCDLLNYCAIIGDVHADAVLLGRLLDLPELINRPKLFLGDLLTRGPEAKEVLNIILGLGPSATAVMGNHDRLLLRFYDDGAFLPFASAGGLATIRSYVGVAYGDVHSQFRYSFPLRHLEFIRNMRPFIETSELIVSHAGLDPSHPESRTFDALSTGHSNIFRHDENLTKRVICGHYVQESGTPFSGKRLTCIDTGCGTNEGPLTALLLPEWRFVTTQQRQKR
jgi:serine/threonine protein phosphatase 1